MKEFEYLGVLLMTEGRVDQEIERGICSDGDTLLVCFGKKKKEPRVKAELSFCSCPHPWPQSLGSDRKNEIKAEDAS